MECVCDKNCKYNVFLDLSSIERRLKHVDDYLWRCDSHHKDPLPFESILRVRTHFFHAYLHSKRLLGETCNCYHQRLRADLLKKHFTDARNIIRAAVYLHSSQKFMRKLVFPGSRRHLFRPRINPVTFHSKIRFIRKVVHCLTALYSRFEYLDGAFKAAISGNADLLRSALKAKLGENKTGVFQCSPMHAAAFVGSLDCIEILRENNCIPDSNMDILSPLHMAVVAGNIAAAEGVFQSGLNVNARDFQEDTPLHVAAMDENLELVHFLTCAGADVSLSDRLGFKPSYLASAMCRRDLMMSLCFKSKWSYMWVNDEEAELRQMERVKSLRASGGKGRVPDSDTDLSEYEDDLW